MGNDTFGGGLSDFFAYPHPSGGLRLRVNPGNLYTGASDPLWVAQQDTSTLTAPVTNPRIDVAVLNNTTGAVSWVAGSEGASPSIPAIPGTNTPLWAVYLRVGTTSIDRFGYNTGTNSYIYRDMRPGQGLRVPTGAITSGMILDGTILDADIAAAAEIAVSKLADGAPFQYVMTDAAGTGVEWSYFKAGPVDEYSANQTLTTSNRVVKVVTSGGSVTLTLPAASGNAGLAYLIVKLSAANSLIIDGNASETINGATTLTLTAQYDSRIIVCDGDEWHTYGGGGAGGSIATDFDAKGDLLVGSADDAYNNLPVGANGTVLEADSAQTLGVKWGSKEGGASAFRFHDDDLTASLTSVAMNIPGDTGLTEIVMPYAGSVIAVSVACQNARTAGTATFKTTINGTESAGLAAVLNGTDTQYAYDTQAAGTDTFTAGQRIGVKVTTDGSWAAGATPSVDVEVFILPAVTPPTGLATASAALAADVTMTNANQFYDGPSVSLAAGTWLITATVYVKNSNVTAVAEVTAKLWDGTTVVNSAGHVFGTASFRTSLPLAGIVSPGSTTTYKVSAACSGTGGVITAAVATNGAGNNACSIFAVRIA